jgi:hypothetical protein
MRPSRAIAGVHLVIGAGLIGRPSTALQLLGYPDDGRGARSVLRVLGLRHLLQGTVEMRGGPAVLLGGAVVDLMHASTGLLYARRAVTGRRAGHRNAALALMLAGLQIGGFRAARRAAGAGGAR